jgi:hypothetical protein
MYLENFFIFGAFFGTGNYSDNRQSFGIRFHILKRLSITYQICTFNLGSREFFFKFALKFKTKRLMSVL